MLNIAVLQLPTLSMSESRIEYYIKTAKENGAPIVLLGEYVLNNFFTELIKMPKSIIEEQSEHKNKFLSLFSKKYDVTIIAPLIIVKANGYLKVCAKYTPTSTKYFEQKLLMNYPHWDENKFFANKINDGDFSLPIFIQDKIKFGILFGFEAHFDICWEYFMSKKVDCVLIPTASTFESKNRWEELLKVRAFTNSVFIIRANRIGKAKFKDDNFDFYGDSMMITPNGEIVNYLKEEEGILMCSIDKKELNSIKNLWNFRDILSKSGLI